MNEVPAEPATAPPSLPAPHAGDEIPSPPLAAEVPPTQNTGPTEPAPPAVVVEAPRESPAQEPEIAPEAAPQPAIADNEAATSRAQRTSRVPQYTLTRPSWGVQISGSTGALGNGKDLTPVQAGNRTRGIQLTAEYQFPFLQSIGVLSAGPSVGIYPIFPSQTVTTGPVSLWDLGAQIRYQARFFRNQPIVPFAGFEAQYFAYRFKDGPDGSLVAQGPFFGGMFLLNVLEPDSAAEFYINAGISRSYLVAEVKTITGKDANISFSGASYFFGLRLEY